MKKFLIVSLSYFIFSMPTCADIASTQYVDNLNKSKVDLSANQEQIMAGDYTITGSIKVPTQPLPTAQ